MNLNGGFDKATPSHPAHAVAALPCSEDLLDPDANPLNRLVPGLEASLYLSFVALSHAGAYDARRFTPGANRVAEMRTTRGTIGEHLSEIIRQGIRTGTSIIDVGRGDKDLLDQGTDGIGPDVRLEAMDCRAALVLRPSATVIALLAER